MPYVNLKMYPGRSEEQKQEVARRIIRAVMEICNVDSPDKCPVVIEEVNPDDWTQSVGPELQAKSDRRYPK